MSEVDSNRAASATGCGQQSWLVAARRPTPVELRRTSMPTRPGRHLNTRGHPNRVLAQTRSEVDRTSGRVHVSGAAVAPLHP